MAKPPKTPVGSRSDRIVNRSEQAGPFNHRRLSPDGAQGPGQRRSGFRQKQAPRVQAFAEPISPSLSARTKIADYEALAVVDDWPKQVPVTKDELDVLETFFAELLNDLLS